MHITLLAHAGVLLWQVTVSIFLFVEVQKLHSRSACRLLPREDIIYAYMQELNAVVLYVVIFGPSQFWLASVLLTSVLVRHTARNQ